MYSKIALCLSAVLLLTACDAAPNPPNRTHSKEGYRIQTYDKVCLEGVVYYTSGYKLAPAYLRNGHLQLCD